MICIYSSVHIVVEFAIIWLKFYCSCSLFLSIVLSCLDYTIIIVIEALIHTAFGITATSRIIIFDSVILITFYFIKIVLNSQIFNPLA